MLLHRLFLFFIFFLEKASDLVRSHGYYIEEGERSIQTVLYLLVLALF